jgi:flagellar L-ring protein precursor FlgH
MKMRLFLLVFGSVRMFAQLTASPGSLYLQGASFGDLTRDVRAAVVGDLVTVVVNDNASAVSSGVSNTQRKSASSNSITGLGGLTDARFVNLLNMNGNNQLQSQGQTSRNTNLSTTVTARVIQVTPGGNLVIEGVKNVGVNSEKQSVDLKGIIRPSDLTPSNTIRSDQVANLTIQINGKGVVGDAIRRPNILYRILAGLLPF